MYTLLLGFWVLDRQPLLMLYIDAENQSQYHLRYLINDSSNACQELFLRLETDPTVKAARIPFW